MLKEFPRPAPSSSISLKESRMSSITAFIFLPDGLRPVHVQTTANRSTPLQAETVRRSGVLRSTLDRRLRCDTRSPGLEPPNHLTNRRTPTLARLPSSEGLRSP